MSLSDHDVGTNNLPSYVICDPKKKGHPIRHASQGFQELFGYSASECIGLQVPSCLGAPMAELTKIGHSCGLSADETRQRIERIQEAAEEAAQCAAEGTSTSSPLLLTKRNGEVIACEISWCQSSHPKLGWSYLACAFRELGDASVVPRLLVAGHVGAMYEELCSDMSDGLPTTSAAEQLRASSEDLHAAAEQMWKDELAKGIKPKSSSKTRSEETSSIWSRSTASTTTSSRDSKEPKAKADACAHHFGALLGILPEKDGAPAAPTLETKGMPETAQTPLIREDLDFESVCGDDSWEECETLSASSEVSSGPPLFEEVEDPVKHVDRASLQGMTQAFALASLSVDGFPVALKSKGLEELFGPSRQVKMGSDAREVLRPSASNTRALEVWQDFSAAMQRGDFFCHQKGSGLALLHGQEFPLPAGEFAFVQPFHGRFGNSLDCLVYLKQVELDDCPFLLALHCFLPDEDERPEHSFYKVGVQVDEVIGRMASEFFYYAPMRSQRPCR